MKGEKTIFTLRNRRNIMYVKLLSASSNFYYNLVKESKFQKESYIYIYGQALLSYTP